MLEPEQGEHDGGAGSKRCGRQVEDMNAKPRVLRGVIAGRVPAVARPVDLGRFQYLDAQVLARNSASAAIKTPDHEVRRDALCLVPLHRFGRHIKNPAVLKRAQQFNVLGMRPDQRHGGTRGFAAKQFALGNVVTVPDLLRN